MAYMYMYTVLTISTWNYFHNYIKEFTNVLGKNQFPYSLVNRTVKQCLSMLPQHPLAVHLHLQVRMDVGHPKRVLQT